MKTFEMVLLEFGELRAEDLRRWIVNAWIRPEGEAGFYRFHDIDLARIRLIMELRGTMEVSEPALPTVLSLLDQLYEMRRHMLRLNRALASVPADIRSQLQETFDVRP